MMNLQDIREMSMLEEIELWVVNDGDLYPTIQCINKNLARKMIRGTYDSEKAPKAYYGVVCMGMKNYFNQCCEASPFFRWYHLLSVKDRNILCLRLVNYYWEDIENRVDDIRKNK